QERVRRPAGAALRDLPSGVPYDRREVRARQNRVPAQDADSLRYPLVATAGSVRARQRKYAGRPRAGGDGGPSITDSTLDYSVRHHRRGELWQNGSLRSALFPPKVTPPSMPPGRGAIFRLLKSFIFS